MHKPKAKKLKISKVKRNNQKRTKLSKQGKLKQQRHHNKHSQPQKAQNVPKAEPIEEEEESDHGADLLDMVEKDDLKFLQSAISKKSYTLLQKIRLPSSEEDPTANRRQNRKQKRKLQDEDDLLEDNYENVQKSDEGDEGKKMRLLMPLKTKEGVVKKRLIERTCEEEEEEPPNEAEEPTEFSDNDSEKSFDVQTPQDEPKEEVTTIELLACRDEILRSRKLKIGVLSSSLLENPQGKSHNFKKLLDLFDEADSQVCITVKKLTIVSLLEVFRDLLPAYCIGGGKEEGVKYKKETLELKNYEEILLRSYKNYLHKLDKLAGVLKKKSGDTRVFNSCQIELGHLAVSSLCQLLIAHPYFNYALNIANCLIPLADNRHEKARTAICQCFSQVFSEDRRGELSLSIVRKLNQYIKAHEQTVNPEIISLLLSLRIKDVNLDEERKEEAKQKRLQSHKQRVLALSKRERKKSKKLVEIEQEMLETKATESKAKKQKIYTEITSIVFTIYFRILKRSPNRRILSACLEGLAKFAGCINLEFYQDLVNAINTLMKEGNLGQREQLHCIQTVFTILSGQGSALNLDPYVFYVHLYKQMFNVHGGKTERDCAIVVEVLMQVLVNRRKNISQNRLVAFVKRVSTMCLQVQHHGALGLLGLVKSIVQLGKNGDILLDTDTASGDGVYDPELDEPEYCNANRSALWELVALQRHYHSAVQKMARYIACRVPSTGEGVLPVEISKLSPSELFANYDPTRVAFNPAVPAPKAKSASKLIKNWEFSSGEFDDYVKTMKSKSPASGGIIDFSAAIL